MSNGENRTPFLKNEDWWSCLIGWFILVLGILGFAPATPKIGTWEVFDLAVIFPSGLGATAITTLIFFAFCLVCLCVSCIFLNLKISQFIPGFLIIFIISVIAMVISKQAFMSEWGISYVLFALVIGLLISNFIKVPEFLKTAGQTEYFVKIGLVCMGATIIISDVIKGGLFGLIQALVVATAVWFMTYYICRWFKVSERFSAIIASANAICGVSATIAAGGAIQGDSKEVSYMVAWVLVCAVVLILVMPPIAIWLNLSEAWAGGWMGGVIDNTGAVVAAGEVLKSEIALKVATMVKMSQNVLIGLAAFLMALWGSFKLDKAEGAEAPSFMEVWYRFPKFVVGFVVSSLIVSIFVPADSIKAVSGVCKHYRSWFFTFCFVGIGLETRFWDLISVGGGRPAIAYWISQFLNALWTLLIAWILWSGTFFPVPL